MSACLHATSQALRKSCNPTRTWPASRPICLESIGGARLALPPAFTHGLDREASFVCRAGTTSTDPLLCPRPSRFHRIAPEHTRTRKARARAQPLFDAQGLVPLGHALAARKRANL